MEFKTEAQAKKETGLSYIGTINSSSKLIKNKKVSGQYTYIIYLAPYKQSGYNVCPYSTPECRMGCLSNSGRAGMEYVAGKTIISNCRITKTKLLFEHQTYFMNWVVAEMTRWQNKAKKDGFEFSARLNGTSDIHWENILLNGKNIYELFPDVQFYDYTKSPKKMDLEISNYHLTYSFTGKNNKIAKKLIEKGKNVAVVFNVHKNQSLPNKFNGYKVVDGDKTDYRPDDGNNVIVGLRFKHIGNKQAESEIKNSCFVIQPTDKRCS